MDQKTIDEWNADTPKKLPQHVKQAGLQKIADSLAPAISIQHRAEGTRPQRWSPKDEKDVETPQVRKPWKDPELTRSRYDGPASEVSEKSV